MCAKFKYDPISSDLECQDGSGSLGSLEYVDRDGDGDALYCIGKSGIEKINLEDMENSCDQCSIDSCEEAVMNCAP